MIFLVLVDIREPSTFLISEYQEISFRSCQPLHCQFLAFVADQTPCPFRHRSSDVERKNLSRHPRRHVSSCWSSFLFEAKFTPVLSAGSKRLKSHREGLYQEADEFKLETRRPSPPCQTINNNSAGEEPSLQPAFPTWNCQLVLGHLSGSESAGLRARHGDTAFRLESLVLAWYKSPSLNISEALLLQL